MQVAQNVGSTLRPTPEMVEIIENVKKFREALETIRDFGEKMKKYAVPSAPSTAAAPSSSTTPTASPSN